MTDKDKLLELAEIHEAHGIRNAEAATKGGPWSETRNEDTLHSANHFAVAAALRAIAGDEQ